MDHNHHFRESLGSSPNLGGVQGVSNSILGGVRKSGPHQKSVYLSETVYLKVYILARVDCTST